MQLIIFVIVLFLLAGLTLEMANGQTMQNDELNENQLWLVYVRTFLSSPTGVGVTKVNIVGKESGEYQLGGHMALGYFDQSLPYNELNRVCGMTYDDIKIFSKDKNYAIRQFHNHTEQEAKRCSEILESYTRTLAKINNIIETQSLEGYAQKENYIYKVIFKGTYTIKTYKVAKENHTSYFLANSNIIPKSRINEVDDLYDYMTYCTSVVDGLRSIIRCLESKVASWISITNQYKYLAKQSKELL